MEWLFLISAAIAGALVGSEIPLGEKPKPAVQSFPTVDQWETSRHKCVQIELVNVKGYPSYVCSAWKLK